MKTSELITILQKKLKEHGDIEVRIEAQAQPRYYEDGNTADCSCVSTILAKCFHSDDPKDYDEEPQFNLLLTRYTAMEMGDDEDE